MLPTLLAGHDWQQEELEQCLGKAACMQVKRMLQQPPTLLARRDWQQEELEQHGHVQALQCSLASLRAKQ